MNTNGVIGTMVAGVTNAITTVLRKPHRVPSWSEKDSLPGPGSFGDVVGPARIRGEKSPFIEMPRLAFDGCPMNRTLKLPADDDEALEIMVEDTIAAMERAITFAMAELVRDYEASLACPH